MRARTPPALSSMTLACFLRCRRVGLFFPFMRFFSSFASRCSLRAAAAAASASARRSATTSFGSLRTCARRDISLQNP
jgi:hypothetical protein